MADNAITTFPALLQAVSNVAGLQLELEVYDTKGNRYNIVEVYVPEEQDDLLCIDVELVARD